MICLELCYDDINICLWTDGSALNQSDAQTACQQRNNSFLPRITNSDIQSKLAEFRSAARNLLGVNGFWIDVKATDPTNFHWVDGSSLSGISVSTSRSLISINLQFCIHYSCILVQIHMGGVRKEREGKGGRGWEGRKGKEGY